MKTAQKMGMEPAEVRAILEENATLIIREARMPSEHQGKFITRAVTGLDIISGRMMADLEDPGKLASMEVKNLLDYQRGMGQILMASTEKVTRQMSAKRGGIIRKAAHAADEAIEETEEFESGDD